MTLHVVVSISGREALPIWILPYVTGWNLSSNMLMDRLVCPSYDSTAFFPTAFQLDNANHPLLTTSEQWEGLHIKIASISAQLKNEKLSLAYDRDQWCIRSIKEMMQYRAYVWLDEFKNWFNKQLYAHKTVKIDGHGLQYEDIGSELCLNPVLSQECTQYLTDEKKLLATTVPFNTSAPLDNKDREALEKQIFNKGAPTIALDVFIDMVLVNAIDDRATLPTFYQLMENYGLVVYDKVIDGKQVSSSQLLSTLRQREQQEKELWDDDRFQFWGTLNKEKHYSVCREAVAKAYKNAKKIQFPWLNLENEFVWLNCLLGNESKNREAKRNLKEKLPQEPQSLNLRYKPGTGKSFKQEKWEAIPNVNQKYWKHRDTLTIIEFAFILKEKEPQPKVTQRSVLNLYPLDFCEFFAELLTQADSSWKTGRLTIINPPAPYCEEWADSPEFEREELIKWAISKEIEVPEWLNSQQGTQIGAKSISAETKKNIPIPKPWLIPDPEDPKPEYDWYTPARYFARQLIVEKPSLLDNRSLLVSKIATSLSKVGINKRGNKKPFNPDTIKKALSNVDFS